MTKETHTAYAEVIPIELEEPGQFKVVARIYDYAPNVEVDEFIECKTVDEANRRGVARQAELTLQRTTVPALTVETIDDKPCAHIVGYGPPTVHLEKEFGPVAEADLQSAKDQAHALVDKEMKKYEKPAEEEEA